MEIDSVNNTNYSNGLSDIAIEILKHVKHPDSDFKIWEICILTRSHSELTLEKHIFEIRAKSHNEIYMKNIQNNMILDLSTTKSNVQLYHSSYLNLKCCKIRRNIEIFIQLQIESTVIERPATFNNKYIRKYDSYEEEASTLDEKITTLPGCNRHELKRLFYMDFISDIIKLVVGYKLGFFDPQTHCVAHS
tara:strand:- start:334 stop:906 length:573 start_codon:yes stop_codon:yes gene_type:complete